MRTTQKGVGQGTIAYSCTGNATEFQQGGLKHVIITCYSVILLVNFCEFPIIVGGGSDGPRPNSCGGSHVF